MVLAISKEKNYPKIKYQLTKLELLQTDLLTQFLDIMNIAGSSAHSDETELTDLKIPLEEYLSESAFEDDYPQEYRMYLNLLNHLDNEIERESELENELGMMYGDVVVNIVDSKEKLDDWRKNVYPKYAAG
jgi:hypothetical protein